MHSRVMLVYHYSAVWRTITSRRKGSSCGGHRRILVCGECYSHASTFTNRMLNFRRKRTVVQRFACWCAGTRMRLL
jgi:hypothetical protein